MKLREAFVNKKAFIPFVTCGDPDLETTKKLIEGMSEAGADIIELGIPFSDPTAEGPVIQGANLRALKGNVTTDKIFDMVKTISVKTPLVFMTYANVVFSYGIERFMKTCKEVGIRGIILPDVPFEEKNEFLNICDIYEIEFISLIAPTSKERVSMIAKEARGFIYCVSSLGVTGMRDNIAINVKEIVEVVKEVTEVPVAVGFGISTTEQAKAISADADGVIVGSAIVKIIADYGRASVEPVVAYVKAMKEACNK